MTDSPTIPDLSGALSRLDALGAVLDRERAREDGGKSPQTGTLRDAAVHLRVELNTLRSVVDELGEWGAPTPILAAAYAVSLENLTLAWHSLESTEESINPHSLLHLLRDVVFHARRAVEGLSRLEDETLAESRRLSREENRQDFMAG